jgi:hypothetical protein
MVSMKDYDMYKQHSRACYLLINQVIAEVHFIWTHRVCSSPDPLFGSAPHRVSSSVRDLDIIRMKQRTKRIIWAHNTLNSGVFIWGSMPICYPTYVCWVAERRDSATDPISLDPQSWGSLWLDPWSQGPRPGSQKVLPPEMVTPQLYMLVEGLKGKTQLQILSP